MAQYIDKNEVENILRNLWKQDDGNTSEHRICYNKALQEVQCKLDTLEVKDPYEQCVQYDSIKALLSIIILKPRIYFKSLSFLAKYFLKYNLLILIL